LSIHPFLNFLLPRVPQEKQSAGRYYRAIRQAQGAGLMYIAALMELGPPGAPKRRHNEQGILQNPGKHARANRDQHRRHSTDKSY